MPLTSVEAALPMNRLPATYPVIRLFVSSTFRDWVHGRDFLQAQVFPAFDAWCRERGARFRAVDLRWGVSVDAGLDRQALAICLAEIARCQRSTPRPNFLILLGERYGWRPLPAQMPCEDFEALAPRLEARRERPLLQTWYPLDLNARPPTRLLRSRLAAVDPGAEPWPAVERELGGALRRAVAALGWPAARRRRYEASATELEIYAGALQVDDAADHVLCVRRTMGTAAAPGATGFDDADAPQDERPAIDALRAELERALRQKLGPRFVELDAGWDGAAPDRRSLRALGKVVRDGFKSLVAERLKCVAAIDPGTAEARVQAEHAESLARIVIGRDAELQRLHDEVVAPGGGPLVVVGPRGGGKSSLLARLLVQCRAERTEPPPLFAFIGLTSASSSGLRLLAALNLALAGMLGDEHAVLAPPSAYDELAQQFLARLDQVASARRVLLVVDALDQLDAADPARNLAWLPHQLPPGPRSSCRVRPARCRRCSNASCRPGASCHCHRSPLQPASRCSRPGSRRTAARCTATRRPMRGGWCATRDCRCICDWSSRRCDAGALSTACLPAPMAGPACPIACKAQWTICCGGCRSPRCMASAWSSAHWATCWPAATVSPTTKWRSCCRATPR